MGEPNDAYAKYFKGQSYLAPVSKNQVYEAFLPRSIKLHIPFSFPPNNRYAEGKIKAIGISNFYPDRMVDLANFARIKPMVNQVNSLPFFRYEPTSG